MIRFQSRTAKDGFIVAGVLLALAVVVLILG
jgi:hypothetical protein